VHTNRLSRLIGLPIQENNSSEVSRVGEVALYTVLWSVVANYRKWPFSAPRRTIVYMFLFMLVTPIERPLALNQP
jgi:hypothetical protein